MQSVWLHYRVWWERKRGEMWVTRSWTAKTFQDSAANAKSGEKRDGVRGWTIHNRKCEISQKPKPENRLKGSLNIYISSLLPSPFLCPYFLKNQITQIPEQEKLMALPNNIIEITHDFEGKESLFMTADQRNRGGGECLAQVSIFCPPG